MHRKPFGHLFGSGPFVDAADVQNQRVEDFAGWAFTEGRNPGIEHFREALQSIFQRRLRGGRGRTRRIGVRGRVRCAGGSWRPFVRGAVGRGGGRGATGIGCGRRSADGSIRQRIAGDVVGPGGGGRRWKLAPVLSRLRLGQFGGVAIPVRKSGCLPTPNLRVSPNPESTRVSYTGWAATCRCSGVGWPGTCRCSGVGWPGTCRSSRFGESNMSL